MRFVHLVRTHEVERCGTDRDGDDEHDEPEPGTKELDVEREPMALGGVTNPVRFLTRRLVERPTGSNISRSHLDEGRSGRMCVLNGDESSKHGLIVVEPTQIGVNLSSTPRVAFELTQALDGAGSVVAGARE